MRRRPGSANPMACSGPGNATADGSSKISAVRFRAESSCGRFDDTAAVPSGRWIGTGVLGNSLEDESLLCEFVGAPVSGGGAESLVVGPPHIVVEAGAWLFQAGVVVPVYELLLQEPAGGFDHGVVVRVALP